MVLNRVYVIPHGDEIIDMPNENARKMNEIIKEVTKDDKTQNGLIISPHSVRLSKGIAVINTEYLKGYYKLETKILRATYKSFRELNSEIIKNCPETVELNFITNSGKLSVFPLDFGSLIPLKFFHFKNLSLIGQPRFWDNGLLMKFGSYLYDIIERSNQYISVIFSADQAHTHHPKGPYGYSEKAKLYDNLVIEAIKNNNFQKLIDLDKETVEDAKPDSYWNLIILSGFMHKATRSLKFEYYYVEKYFGMLFACG